MPKKLVFLVLSLLSTAPLAAADGIFEAVPVPDSVWTRMAGRSVPRGAAVDRRQLRYLRLSYVDFEGRECVGELVCNSAIAADLVEVFRELFRQRYPIASLRLIDDFDADDERSMRANNTSCFCYRPVAGTRKLSAHSRGMAIDINPLQNPCVRRRRDGHRTVEPATATTYVDRSRSFPHKIDRSDLAYRLLVLRGFRWGGAWRTLKDYQHFER